MNPTKLMDNTLQIACPICAHRSSWILPFLNLDSVTLTYRADGYHWRVCLFCGNGYPSAEAELQDLQKYWDVNRVAGLSMGDAEVTYQARLRDAMYWADQTYNFVSPHTKRNSRRFLDIACGLGATVKKFKDMGWDSVGVDADMNAQESHVRLGIRSVIGQFENIELGRNFDIISIAHAIYFITDYRALVDRIKSSLARDGLLLIVISNFTSSLGANSPSQIHTWYPTPISLSNAMLLSGFCLVSRRSTKGSTLMLFRETNKLSKPSFAFWSAFMLKSHNVRYRLFGKNLINFVRLCKGFVR